MLKLGRCIGSIVTCVQMSSSNDTRHHEAAAAAAATSVQKMKGLKNGGILKGIPHDCNKVVGHESRDDCIVVQLRSNIPPAPCCLVQQCVHRCSDEWRWMPIFFLKRYCMAVVVCSLLHGFGVFIGDAVYVVWVCIHGG